MPGVHDPSVAAWINAVAIAGGTVSNQRRNLVDDLIVGLKSDGVWPKLDRLWIYAAENQGAALTDMALLAKATAIGGPPFTVDRGFAGQLTAYPTAYIDSGFREQAGVAFKLNDCHIGAWAVTTCAGGYMVGQIGHAADTTSSILDNGTLIHIDCTDSTGNGPNFTYTAGQNLGHFVGCRTSSTALQLYHNGASVGTASSTSGSITNVSWTWSVTCIDDHSAGHVSENGSTGILAAVSAGGSLTAGDATNFYNRLRTYMTAVGVP